MKKIFIILMIVTSLTFSASAAPIGMNTHWGQNISTDTYIPLLNEMKASWVRDAQD